MVDRDQNSKNINDSNSNNRTNKNNDKDSILIVPSNESSHTHKLDQQ